MNTITQNTLACLIAASSTLASPALAGGTHATDAEVNIGAPGNADQADRVIEVAMTDNAFSIEDLAVEDGETITFQLSNEGDFVHEFNVGTVDMHEGHQEEMMDMMAKGMFSVDEKPAEMGHDDENSIMLAPGEKAEFTWTFARADDLQFACNVPGHYQSGMVGDIAIIGGGQA